jgi:hypothetical protein
VGSGSNRLRLMGIAAVTAGLMAAASPAAASVTIGQVADSTGSFCDPLDWLQPTVPSGNSYVVPDIGGVTAWTVTSWTTNSTGPTGQEMNMKMFRKVSDPMRYQVVGHAGPQPLTPGGTAGNTFPASIAVKSGDVLGFHTVAEGVRCAFIAPGEPEFLFADSDLTDGASGDFDSEAEDVLLDISATIVPDNNFSVTGTSRNRKKGTARVSFNLPNPGVLAGTGKGAKVAATTPTAAGSLAVPGSGPSQLLVKAKGKKKRKLNDTGKVKLGLTVTYTPTGGDPRSQPVKVKLKTKL